MDKKQFEKIKAGCTKNGIIIKQDREAQDILDFYKVEAMTLGDIIMLRPNPTRSAIFEELIHVTQSRRGKITSSIKDRTLCEIEAKEKLIKHQKAYKIPDSENEKTKTQLKDYLEYYEKIVEDKD